MPEFRYVKPQRIHLKTHPEFNERWVQDRIAEDPKLLGLGDIVVKDKERSQPHAGRLDLLCQDDDANKRYEIEIQLGATDEKHIVRTIEYWDIERKLYPRYDHTAVLIAEDVTSRFLNVISLFNRAIPLVAIQMSAFTIENAVSLTFATVLNEMQLGLDDEEEESREATDRAYWERRGAKNTVEIADALLGILNTVAPNHALKYNKHYIGLANSMGLPNNFAIFRPKKEWTLFEPRLEKSDEIQAMLESAGIDVMEYDGRWGRYRIRITRPDLTTHESLIRELMRRAAKLGDE